MITVLGDSLSSETYRGRRAFLKAALYLGAAAVGTSLSIKFLLGDFPSQPNTKSGNSTNVSAALHSCQTDLSLAVSEKAQLDSLLADYKNTTSRLLTQLDNSNLAAQEKEKLIRKYAEDMAYTRERLASALERLNGTSENLATCRADYERLKGKFDRIVEAVAP